MIRVLFMIAIAGFVLSVGTLAAAVALGGPEAIARGGWVVAGKDWRGDWNWDWDWDEGEGKLMVESGPQATRTLAWSGADRLDIDLPAEVRYVQSAGPATVIVSGPQALIDKVIVRGDSIRYAHGRGDRQRKLTIEVRAPGVTSFDIAGDNSLVIENYSQPRLELEISGAADVNATGQTEEVDLDISGSGDVDLGAMKTKGARVDASGAADVILAPSDWARLDISGAGDVRLLTNPPRLETDLSGSGRVRQTAPAQAAPPKMPATNAPAKTL